MAPAPDDFFDPSPVMQRLAAVLSEFCSDQTEAMVCLMMLCSLGWQVCRPNYVNGKQEFLKSIATIYDISYLDYMYGNVSQEDSTGFSFGKQ